MSNQITLVTAPDDVLHPALRILLVDLSKEQTQIVSEALMSFDKVPAIVTYVWSPYDSAEWLVDKRLKSQVVFFNADSNQSEIVGYMVAQPNTYYFGTLKSLAFINNRTIYSTEDFKDLLSKQIAKYEQSLQ